MKTDPELLKPKTKPLLSESPDRATLIAAAICIGCRASKAARWAIHCADCLGKFAMAEKRSFLAKIE